MADLTKEFKVKQETQKEWGFGGRRPQRDGWILLALFLGGAGAGQYVISTLFLNFSVGAIVGVIIALIGKGGAHLIYLGKPLRFWRMFFRPQTSWISRGLIFMVLFIVFAALQIAPVLEWFTWLPWASGTPLGQAVLTIAVAMAFLVMMYDGFVLASSPAISSWHTALLPAIFLLYSVATGLAFTYITIVGVGETVLLGLHGSMDIYLLSFTLLFVAFYMLTLIQSTSAAKESLSLLVKGRYAPFFIGGAILVGIAIPLAFTSYSYIYEITVPGLLVAGSILELVGDLLFRQSILRVGLRSSIT